MRRPADNENPQRYSQKARDALRALDPLGNVSDLSAPPSEINQVPRRLAIPPSYEAKFEQLCSAISRRIEAFGLRSSKTPASLLCLLLEVNEGVVRTGFLGKHRQEFTDRLNTLFGERGWSIQHELQGRLFDPKTAWFHYENAYVSYLQKNPAVLDWVTKNFSDVYDNAPSNVNSGSDYLKQEVLERGHHIHDIAIRNAIRRLRRSFEGTNLLEVRSDKSEGSILSPGKVPFHLPELIPELPFFGQQPWWNPGSIEDFYQQTRRLVVYEYRGDDRSPSDLFSTQAQESYLNRVAARCMIRSLLIMTESQVGLSDISWLPWMLDYNSFPLGIDGLPRTFSNDEMAKILTAACEQLSALFESRRSEKKDQHLLAPDGWLSFNDAQDFLKAVRGDFAGELSEDQEERFPDIVEMRAWERVLPLFEEHLGHANAQPIFLARDGLAIMEYLIYRTQLDGNDRVAANEALQHSIYLPGGTKEKTTKNARAEHPLFDATTFHVTRIARECRASLMLFEPPQEPHIRAQLHALFEQKVHELLDDWCQADHHTNEGKLYQWWFDTYQNIRDSFTTGMRRVSIVDSDGSGKTALFIKSVISYFAHQRGDKVSADIILGALQREHLGVKNIVELNNLEGQLPDMRWPFRFADFDGEPKFNVRQSPKFILTLIYRTLKFYNLAVQSKRNNLANASDAPDEH